MTGETLLGCPSCGAAPLHNLSKGWRDQLHGELHQDHILRCPHGCFKASRSTYKSTVTEWNTRALAPALDTVIAEVEDRLTALWKDVNSQPPTPSTTHRTIERLEIMATELQVLRAKHETKEPK